LGTRLMEETVARPKPMVEIGGKPVLWHIMSHYAAYGLDEFVVALGYKGESIREYFQSHPAPGWSVELVDTGANTMTGGRIKRLAPYLGDSAFMASYGDGLADVDLRALLDFHRSHGRIATLTAAKPPESMTR